MAGYGGRQRVEHRLVHAILHGGPEWVEGVLTGDSVSRHDGSGAHPEAVVTAATREGGSGAGQGVHLAAGSHAEVMAVEPEGSADFVLSVASGRRESVTVGATLADGLQLATIGVLPWEIVRGRVPAPRPSPRSPSAVACGSSP